MSKKDDKMKERRTKKEKKEERKIKIGNALKIGFFVVAVGILAFVLIRVAFPPKPPPTDIDRLINCLNEKGAVLYISPACEYCRQQLIVMESDTVNLTIVDCTAEPQICRELDIRSVPTWVFEDGNRLVGGHTPDLLANRTGCT